MRRFSLLLALLIFCSGAGAVEAPRNLNDYPTDHPMRIVVVRSSQPGCEPKCAEWISAEGDIVLATAEQLRTIVNSLNGRKLPILIHSGGGIINQAMLMGFLIRARGLDVAVARTAFDPCASTPGGCKQGTWSGPLGEPESQTALCNTSCTFVLAGGVRRFVGPEPLVGVQNFRLTPAVLERWRQTYRGTTPMDTVIQRSFVPPMTAYERTYFRKLGISEDIVELMVSTAEPRILTETELLKLRLATEVKDGREVVYGYKGGSDRAIADYSKAIELDPKLASAYANRGIANEKKGDHDRAIADFDKVIELDPKSAPAAYGNRGIAYWNKGEYDRAIADYSKAIELDPKSAATYNNLGSAYGKKGDYDRAIADYGKAIEIDPKYASAYKNRGYAYKKKGEYDRAIADFDKVIEIDPKDAHAYNGRAMVYFTAGKPAQGLPDVEKSLELHPDYPEALDTRGLIFEALDRKQEAIADFRRALALAPDLQSSKDALNRLGALGTP